MKRSITRSFRQITLLVSLLSLVICVSVNAYGSRTRTSINDGWKFVKSDPQGAQQPEHDDTGWQRLDLPHTWNVEDPWDDEPVYFRGAGWYRRELRIESDAPGKRYFVFFEGANQVTDVYVNGTKAGSHIGGYSAFAFDITAMLRPDGKNVLAIRVDNSFNEDIPPLTADFNFYGGIYRDVWLIETSDLHIDVTDHASPGITITTPDIEKGIGRVEIKGTVNNASAQARNFEIVTTVLDASNARVAEGSVKVTAKPSSPAAFSQDDLRVDRPKLWSPESPYLYKVRVAIREKGRIVDEITQSLGFRWFRFDPDQGFFLNGKHLKLRGTNRHQDRLGMGNAVPDELQVRDIEIVKNAGFNYLRLAHYPQDPSVLEACDRLGLLVWEETPLVNYITNTPAFADNSRTMVREMVRQHRNHPSVLMWGYMNEIFLRHGANRPDLHEPTVRLAKELNSILKTEDPTRPTTIAFHGSEIYNQTGLGEVADVIGWNLYHGWYVGTFPEFGTFMDDQHKRFPKRPLIVSEYGANADRRLHSTEPRRFDSTIEWQRMFHESHLAQMNARPFIAGTAIWNQFDFGAEQRGETIPHLNQKGMYYFDRKPKDIHFFYKANLSSDDVLHIATRDWNRRAGSADKAFAIDIYSNLSEVELSLNGRSLGKKQVDDSRKATWQVTFAPGRNRLQADGVRNGRPVRDVADILYTVVTAASPQIAVNVGSNADFIEPGGPVWLADQPYSVGGWGFIGANAKRNYGVPPDPNIRGTDLDPLFQTNVEGLSSYRFDVPDGTYDVELLFTEKLTTAVGKRVFSVTANGREVIRSLDIFAEAGDRKWLRKTFTVSTENGIDIGFNALAGNTILSGIIIKRK